MHQRLKVFHFVQDPCKHRINGCSQCCKWHLGYVISAILITYTLHTPKGVVFHMCSAPQIAELYHALSSQSAMPSVFIAFIPKGLTALYLGLHQNDAMSPMSTVSTCRHFSKWEYSQIFDSIYTCIHMYEFIARS